MTDIELITYLSNGYKVCELAKKHKLDRRTLERRLIALRARVGYTTVTQLVAMYLRKRIIE